MLPGALTDLGTHTTGTAADTRKVTALDDTAVITFSDADQLFFFIVVIIRPLRLAGLPSDELANRTAKIFVFIQPAGLLRGITDQNILVEKLIFSDTFRIFFFFSAQTEKRKQTENKNLFHSSSSPA